MTFKIRLCFVLVLLGTVSTFVSAQSKQDLWQQSTKVAGIDARFKQSILKGYELNIDSVALDKLKTNQLSEFTLAIPTPEGEFLPFKFKQVKVMADELAAKFPSIRSFSGFNINNPKDEGRFDLSDDGLSGMFKIDGQWAILTFDKLNDKQDYVSYWVKDEVYPNTENSHLIQQQDFLSLPSNIKALSRSLDATNNEAARANGNAVTTYRIAISTSGEYTTQNGGEAGTIAELARLINRINEVLLTDLAIQFEIVANNDRIIYTDSSTDPFTNNASDDLDANQIAIDDLIGAANYDIGHVLNTDSGGLATIQSICVENFKARGQTGSNRPFGESFYIGLVIHEFGHQLGAEHTFNAANSGACSEDQRSRNSAVEPGSGSTVMSYAGICGSQNIEDDSEDYFHSHSVEQIQTVLSRRNCGSVESNGNAIPVISTSQYNHTIPANTPFVLSAEVTDADNDQLTFVWDQINPGGFDGITESAQEMAEDNGFNPLFRSNPPSSSATRYFPQLNQVLNNSVSFGEAYPTTERELTFELMVRDGNGGVNTLLANLDVQPTNDAFSVSRPETDVRWIGGQSHLVQWNVAQTNVSPISCANVDILLDADGDQVFESILLANTSNDGQENIISPSTDTSNARLMVRCSDNVFYAVNPGRFEIVPGDDPVAPLITGQITRSASEDTSFTLDFDDLIVDDPDSAYPSNFSLDILPGANYVATGTSVTPNTDFSGTLTLNVVVNDGVSDSNVFAFVVQIEAVNDAPVAVNDSLTIEQDSGQISIDALDNDTDVDQDTLIISDVTYVGSGRVSIENGLILYTPANGFFGSDSIIYRIEDPSFATDSGTINITVTQINTNPTPPPTTTPDNSSGGGSIGWMLSLLVLLRLSAFKAVGNK
ncbi:reprolysin-like metallopeptidase [Aliiglaciecola lipolytica]|uniref:PPE repeat-containing protein n=1 Tax=Aliiglaciecola lipolytica E3 TaxID=1127673 RepID=K6YHD4_9ALTE|nr:zinc-dependent metalloprotease family protein [Aliiglaciecola lipolytica]GAC16033.1 PPE repeat-containing protein [Aliiglaciecola lipolytica E3]